MDCSAIQSRIHQLLDQRRQPEQDAAVTEHCQGCPHCAEQLQLLLQLEATVRALPRPEPSPDLAGRIVQQVVGSFPAEAAPAAEPSRRQRWDAAALVAAVALGLVAVLAVDALLRVQPVEPELPRPTPNLARQTAPAPVQELQEDLRQLMAETQRELQQFQALLPETQRVASPPSMGAEVLSPVAELVRPLQPVAKDTFSTLGTFWSRVTGTPPESTAQSGDSG